MQRPQWVAWLAAIGAGGLAFQVAHFVEHGVQLGYWFGHPADSPFLTPWAASGANWLAHGTTGVELLHLVGNVIFWLGLIALALAWSARGGNPRGSSGMTIAIMLQGVHVLEHVALVVTWLTVGEAIGISTGFGALGGSALITTRVWFHFLINMVATVCAVQGLWHMYRDGFLVAEPDPTAA